MPTLDAPPVPLDAATRSCRASQQAWARLSVRQRLRPVAAFRRLLVDACDELTAAVARDTGKPPEETLASEILPLADACRFLQREAGRLLKPRRVSVRHRPFWMWGQGDTVYRRPRGLIGLIGTWNYPVMLNGVQLLQALTAGNGVLWKPSEWAASTAGVTAGLLHRAGFPEGLVHLLPATRAAGEELAQADIDYVIFTGSSATGRRLAETLARRLIPSTMELSGCDPLFVLDDADLGMAARAAWFGATWNRGQTCVAVRRVFVPEALYPSFVDLLRPLVQQSSPVKLVMAAQSRQADQLVHDALQSGATVLEAPRTTDGQPESCPPRAILDARPEMAVCREAAFAPLLAVLPYATLADALGMNARCPYALGASVFTRHPERATALAEQLPSGTVAVNDVLVPTAHPATPFGGHRASGWGCTQGAEGLIEMTVPQVVSVKAGTFRPHFDAGPGRAAALGEMLRGVLELSHGGSLGRRWRGLVRLLRAPFRGPKG